MDKYCVTILIALGLALSDQPVIITSADTVLWRKITTVTAGERSAPLPSEVVQYI